MDSNVTKDVKLLDCTLRDGGYYNNWDYSSELITDYFQAMASLDVDYVEIGFRSLKNEGFKGGCAYCTEAFINELLIPESLTHRLGVMVNGAELLEVQSCENISEQKHIDFQNNVLGCLFLPKSESLISFVRIACHVHEFEACLPAANWLSERGYKVGFNLMQVAGCTSNEISRLALSANNYPLDVLYFADSMGSLSSKEIVQIINAIKVGWNGDIGIHTHDSMGQAVTNTQAAINEGVTWVDSTVTGMGRGPGNAQTEYLALILGDKYNEKSNLIKLFGIINKHFKPMQALYGWGVNAYYFLAGQHGIHPSYIQEMLADNRYSEDDVLTVINHLKIEGGKKFSFDTLEAARHSHFSKPSGTWLPETHLADREVLILGTGPGVRKYNTAIEAFIQQHKPYVIALNTQNAISPHLINLRAACHPVRLLADCQEYIKLPQPLVTPVSILPKNIREVLENKELLDFGVCVKPDFFEFSKSYCTLPTSSVMLYALAIANSGKAKKIYLAGFDGYPDGDCRNDETNTMFQSYNSVSGSIELIGITPSKYRLKLKSIYGLLMGNVKGI
jgi:4-hydroxy 2-oxovalerate aldolase